MFWTEGKFHEMVIEADSVKEAKEVAKRHCKVIREDEGLQVSFKVYNYSCV